MVFETLNEGIKVSKNTINENLGRASKGTMAPNVKKPIVESNEAFLRMQKFAKQNFLKLFYKYRLLLK